MNNFATTDSVAGVGRNVNKHSILKYIFHKFWYSVFHRFNPSGSGQLTALQAHCAELCYKIAKISRKMQIFWQFFLHSAIFSASNAGTKKIER